MTPTRKIQINVIVKMRLARVRLKLPQINLIIVAYSNDVIAPLGFRTSRAREQQDRLLPGLFGQRQEAWTVRVFRSCGGIPRNGQR